MNAPQAADLGIGVQPGTPNIIRAFQVIVSGGAGAGIFVYSPAVGAGNLVASLTAASGTDPFGNFYPAGLNVGKIGSGHTHTDIDGSMDFNNNAAQLVATFRPQDQALLIYDPGTTHLLVAVAGAGGTDQFGNVYQQGIGAYPFVGGVIGSYDGTAAGSPVAQLIQGTLNVSQVGGSGTGGTVSGDSSSQKLILSADTGGTVPGQMEFRRGLTIVSDIINVYDPSITHSTPESWHSMGALSNGWSKTGGAAYRWRLLSNGMVVIEMQNTNVGTTTNGTTVVAAANGPTAGSRPSNATWLNVRTDVAGGQSPAFMVGTDGHIECWGIGATATRVDANITYYAGN
jgi:hypothetical protein